VSLGPLSHAKLALAVAGIILFGYGIRADDMRLRWAGIVFLGVAAILRFLGRKRRDDGSAPG
jgi:hypothetical protein